MRKTPFTHQQEAVSQFLHGRNYFNWDTGTGKTYGSLYLASHLGAKKLLVIAPKSSFLSWIAENEEFGFSIELLTYEKFLREGDNLKLSIYDFFIFDEIHRLKNIKAKTTRLALKLFSRIPKDRKVGLSGTPLDKHYEIYSQLKVLDFFYVENLFGKWKDFRKGFYEDRWGNPTYPTGWMRQKIDKAVREKFYKVRREDVVELPELIVSHVQLKNSTQSMPEEYSQFITQYGEAQGIDTEKRIMKDTYKVDWVLDFLEDNPKTIVFSLFKTPVEYIREKSKSNFYYITGDDKKDLEKAINYADKPLIATYSLKEGANLQKYQNIIFLTLPLSYRDFHQSIARVHRTGQKEKVGLYILLGSSIDNQVYEILKTKKSIHEYYRELREA
jgi:superfamily II DNA or RNA helicase